MLYTVPTTTLSVYYYWYTAVLTEGILGHPPPPLSEVLWRSLIIKQGGQLTDSMDISSLAKISDGYTAGHIVTTITQVLTERRIQQVL